MTEFSRPTSCQPSPSDPAAYQFLEDLATAYWSSELIFAALSLGIFSWLTAATDSAALAEAAECHEAELERMLQALASMGLLTFTDGKWQNSAVAECYLVAGREDYLGDFLLYRRYLQEPWRKLADRVSSRPIPAPLSPDDDYQERTLCYVRALDQLARLKAGEIASLLKNYHWQPPILDIGGGAGSLSRRLLRERAGMATIMDLPEVIEAARTLYPAADWQQMQTIAADFRTFAFDESDRFSLVIMANFLHTYDPCSAQELLAKAAGLLSPGGHLLIHDYFPDSTAGAPLKGALYDLNMMLNTYKGHCHPARSIVNWLAHCGLHAVATDLASDSAVLLAFKRP